MKDLINYDPLLDESNNIYNIRSVNNRRLKKIYNSLLEAKPYNLQPFYASHLRKKSLSSLLFEKLSRFLFSKHTKEKEI